MAVRATEGSRGLEPTQVPTVTTVGPLPLFLKLGSFGPGSQLTHPSFLPGFSNTSSVTSFLKGLALSCARLVHRLYRCLEEQFAFPCQIAGTVMVTFGEESPCRETEQLGQEAGVEFTGSGCDTLRRREREGLKPSGRFQPGCWKDGVVLWMVRVLSEGREKRLFHNCQSVPTSSLPQRFS